MESIVYYVCRLVVTLHYCLIAGRPNLCKYSQ